MMNKAKWIVAAALVMTTAGCVESMDTGYAAPSYGYGYGNGSYSSGYYPSQAYYAPPVVYSQTRYVPVPTPVAVPVHQVDRGNDHRSDGRHDEPRHVDHQPSPPPPPAAAHNGGSSSGTHNDTNHRDAGRDRDNDHRG